MAPPLRQLNPIHKKGPYSLFFFKPKRKPLDFNMKIKLNGKRLYLTDSERYLGVKIDSKLNWKSHVNATATKLN